jgi:hypothetical protein
MKKIHLISTSAHLIDNERKGEYIDSYKLIKSFEKDFESITIIETISKVPLDYLENCGLKVCYSKLENPYSNKGVNWLNHIVSFLNDSNIENDDIVVFITGRYKLINLNIISIINDYMLNNEIDFIAKDDRDLYPLTPHGVHTFLIAFTKNKFLDFYKWYEKNGTIEDCIEWDLKKYLESSDKSLILPKDEIMGVETRVSSGIKNKIC